MPELSTKYDRIYAKLDSTEDIYFSPYPIQ